MTSRIGNNTGGHLYISFPAGHDLLYARFYVKFMSGCKPIHHFVTMGGYNPPTPWPQGGAGIRPDGSERFTTGIEPFGTSWRWDFYTYWMHMRGNPTPDFWGNDFTPTPSAQVPCDQWLPVELMMRLNNPVTSFNGEQAFWVDGVRAHHLGEGFPNGDWVWDTFTPSPGGPPFEGFQWRIDPNLRLSFFWLLYYITQGPAGQQDAVLFDDLVIATEYIGPITNAAPTPRLFAYRSGADVRLVWEDTGRSSYRLDRAEAPDLTGRMPIFQGAGLTTSDVAAVPAAASYYYSVD